jgi:hypothetical protein
MATRYVDALSRAFAVASRRGFLAALGTAILAALAGGDAEAARATRQEGPRLRAATPKRRDGHRRKTRRRRKKNDSHPTTPPPPPPAPPPSPLPPPPFCAGQADDTVCEGGRCLQGVCNPTPTCAGGEQRCTADAVCCSGHCEPMEGGKKCQYGAPGSVCLDGDSCLSGVCTGYRCVDTGCLFNNDYCISGVGTCHNGGFCLRPVGQTGPRCGSDTGAAGVCNCTTHQECVAALGTGAFCAQATGSHCACAGAPTFCVAPR